MNFIFAFFLDNITANVMWLAFSGVEPTPSHYKYSKTFHSAADFPQENPEVAIEANRCCAMFFINRSLKQLQLNSSFSISVYHLFPNCYLI